MTMFDQIPVVLGQTSTDVAAGLGKQSADALVTSFTDAFHQVVQLGPKLAAAVIVLAVV